VELLDIAENEQYDLSGYDRINWNWARFEWMMEHPEFDKSTISSIGLWWEQEGIVGAAIYDMYFGEAFCATLSKYEAIYPEILDYAFRTLRDDAGVGIAICDKSKEEIEALMRAKNLGAKNAYVLSDIDFYQKLGFERDQIFTFYWKD